MTNLHIHRKEEDQQTCPIIICDADAGTCRIEGLSFMENSSKFYSPVMAWIYEYIEENNTPFHLHMKVGYMNSSSSKIFFDLFANLKKYEEQGKALGMPYDFRMPTWDKIKDRMWNKNGPMFPPKVFGWGWDLNFAHKGTQVLLIGLSLTLSLIYLLSWIDAPF